MATENNNKSKKRIIIDKTNAKIFIYIAVTVFIVVFSVFAGRSLISQNFYNQKVIGEKKDALSQAEDNIEEINNLEAVYQSFATEPVNVLGGDPKGTAPLDGENPKIVLDALPSVYDYPALSSSIEKILLDGGYQIESIGGTEDSSLAPSSDSTGTLSKNPEPIEISYPLSVNSTAEGIEKLLNTLERSIRPFYVKSITLSGTNNRLQAQISMNTFYQPGTGIIVNSKVVK